MGETPFHFSPDNKEQSRKPALIEPGVEIPEGRSDETPLERIRRRSQEVHDLALKDSMLRGSEHKKATRIETEGDNAMQGIVDAMRGQALFEAAEIITKEAKTSPTLAKFSWLDLANIEETADRLFKTSKRITDLEEAEGVKISLLRHGGENEELRPMIREAQHEYSEALKEADALLEKLKSDYPEVKKALSRPDEHGES